MLNPLAVEVEEEEEEEEDDEEEEAPAPPPPPKVSTTRGGAIVGTRWLIRTTGAGAGAGAGTGCLGTRLLGYTSFLSSCPLVGSAWMIFVRFVDGTGAVVLVASAFLFLDSMVTELNSSSAVLPAAASMEVMSEKKSSRSMVFGVNGLGGAQRLKKSWG